MFTKSFNFPPFIETLFKLLIPSPSFEPKYLTWSLIRGSSFQSWEESLNSSPKGTLEKSSNHVRKYKGTILCEKQKLPFIFQFIFLSLSISKWKCSKLHSYLQEEMNKSTRSIDCNELFIALGWIVIKCVRNETL